MKTNMISVIVPVYNAEPYLRKCVDSILAQTYTNLEIILIDDGSTDGSGAICDEYAKKDKRIIVIHKENGEVSSARNAGLDVAKGEYIAFVDADDFIPKNYFEALYKDMTDDVDLVRCKTDIYWSNEKKDTYSKSLKSTVVLDAADPLNFTKYSYWEVWAALYRISVIGDLRFNTAINFGEDILFFYSVLKKCSKVKYSTSTAYCYVINPESAMHRPFSGMQYYEIYAWRDVCELWSDNAEIEKIFIGIWLSHKFSEKRIDK